MSEQATFAPTLPAFFPVRSDPVVVLARQLATVTRVAMHQAPLDPANTALIDQLEHRISHARATSLDGALAQGLAVFGILSALEDEAGDADPDALISRACRLVVSMLGVLEQAASVHSAALGGTYYGFDRVRADHYPVAPFHS